jgi:hypothetical protein
MTGTKPDCGAQSLVEMAAAWLPTSDPVAAARILAILQQIATNGADPMAELREAMGCWFGGRVAVAMPMPMHGTTVAMKPVATEPVATEPIAAESRLVFETLPAHREATLWPQRPKRLPDELFSSWLWRSAVAASTPPRMFASQALGGPCNDPDRDVKLTILRRLAQRTGQTSAHLAGGLLQVSATANYDIPSSLAENVLLIDDKFLLARAGCDRLGRANVALQYCPLCFQTDARPYFRRGWRLAHMAVCLEHGCRLHDRCWRCDKQVAPLSQRTTDPDPRCSRCLAVLADAPPCLSRARTRQAALQQMLIFVATRVPPHDRRIHVAALRRHFRHDIGGWVAEREHAVGRLSPASAQEWFGAPANGKHALDLQMLVEGAAPEGMYPIATRARRRGARIAAAQSAYGEDQQANTGRKRPLPDYSDTARTAIWNIISGQRDLMEASARQGVQSADQKR